MSVTSSSSSDCSTCTTVSDIRDELREWIENGDDTIGVRVGSTRYVPLRVLVSLARAYLLREYGEDTDRRDVEQAVRGLTYDLDFEIEERELPWDGEWVCEEFAIGVGFRGSSSTDAGWAEFVSDVVHEVDKMLDDDSDYDTDLTDVESSDESEDESDDIPAPVNRGLSAVDIARFVGFQPNGFYVSETAFMPLLDFQINVLLAAKESGEFGENPHLLQGATEQFAVSNGLIVGEMTLPWMGVWKQADFIVGIGQRE